MMLSMDALISIIIATLVILAIPKFSPNLDRAILYKEASDISSVILISKSLDNPITERALVEKTAPGAGLVVETNKVKMSITQSVSGKETLVIERPVFDKRMKIVRFIFTY